MMNQLTLGALSPVADGDSTDALASGLLKKRYFDQFEYSNSE